MHVNTIPKSIRSGCYSVMEMSIQAERSEDSLNNALGLWNNPTRVSLPILNTKF